MKDIITGHEQTASDTVMLTAQMYKRAAVSEGDTARLAKAMKKAARGERILVSAIGGSITQGSLASESTQSYVWLSYKWWLEKFPDNRQIEFINAGIGATDSYIGVHRVSKQLLRRKPDIVIVEFSVNDEDEVRNLKSYDSLVRRILDSEEKPAVILLFTTQENGKSLQSTHMKIGIAYGLPMLSYRNAVLPAIQEGLFKWSDISPDNIHPNTRGHALIGEIIARYLDSVYTRLSVLDCNVKALPKAITEDIYREAEIYNSLNITPAEADGFTVQTVFEPFPDGWHTESGGSLKFEIQAACIGVLYYRTTDGLNGKYTVYIDGKVVGELDGDFSGGWGSYAEAAEIYTSDRKMIHTIEIKTAVDSEKKKFSVLGLSVS